MYENLHKNVNVFIHIFRQIFMSFYDGQLKQQICYSFTGGHQIFPILMVKMLFSQIKPPSGFGCCPFLGSDSVVDCYSHCGIL